MDFSQYSSPPASTPFLEYTSLEHVALAYGVDPATSLAYIQAMTWRLKHLELSLGSLRNSAVFVPNNFSNTNTLLSEIYLMPLQYYSSKSFVGLRMAYLTEQRLLGDSYAPYAFRVGPTWGTRGNVGNSGFIYEASAWGGIEALLKNSIFSSILGAAISGELKFGYDPIIAKKAKLSAIKK